MKIMSIQEKWSGVKFNTMRMMKRNMSMSHGDGPAVGKAGGCLDWIAESLEMKRLKNNGMIYLKLKRESN